jgi:hypothetical protein
LLKIWWAIFQGKWVPNIWISEPFKYLVSWSLVFKCPVHSYKKVPFWSGNWMVWPFVAAILF